MVLIVSSDMGIVYYVKQVPYCHHNPFGHAVQNTSYENKCEETMLNTPPTPHN